MKHPFKRKKGIRRCPINVDNLYRRWNRGDHRIDWPLIEKLLDRWELGEKIPWRRIGKTLIKPGPRPPRRRRRDRRQQTRRNYRCNYDIRDVINAMFDNP